MKSTLADLLSRWSEQNSHVRDLVLGATKAGALKIIAGVLSVGLSIVLGRLLGAEAAGSYFLALTIATIASTIGRVGLDSAVVRKIASHATSNEWANVRTVNRAAMAIGIVGSLTVVIILLVAARLLSVNVFSDPALITPLRLMTLAVVPLSLSVLVSRSLLGLSRIRDSLLVFSILPYGVSLGGTWLLAGMWGVNGAIVAYGISVLAALSYGWVAWSRSLPGHANYVERPTIRAPVRQLLGSSAQLLTGALLQLVMTMSGLFLVGVWADRADVAVFAVAWRTAFLITFVLLAVNTVAQPKFAELYARRDLVSLEVTAHKATTLMTACALPIALVFFGMPEYVMKVFGSDFSGGAAILQILSIGQFVNVAAGSVGILLLMSGHEREYRNVQIASAFVVLTLNVALIPRYGALGAAIAAASALIIQNVLSAYYVWRRLGIVMFVRRHASRST